MTIDDVVSLEIFADQIDIDNNTLTLYQSAVDEIDVSLPPIFEIEFGGVNVG